MPRKNEKTTRADFEDMLPENFTWHGGVQETDDVEGLKKDIIRHIVSSLGYDYARTGAYNYYLGLAMAVRDRLIDRWIRTQRGYYDKKSKRVYYLSLEYLPGKSLVNNLLALDIYDTAKQAIKDLGFDLEDLAEVEWDAGLGNGGLGRLASCYLDSMASLNVSGYGYGIRYDYGIFRQLIEDGWQVEKIDNWMRTGNPWEFTRGQYMYEIPFYGRVREFMDDKGRMRYEWTDTEKVMAMACDLHVPGHGNRSVINMRLWAAKSDVVFKLDYFNTGNYVGAVEDRVRDENISKVLYPSEEVMQGKELRLKQQYFFVAATLQDIMRRYKKYHDSFDALPDKVAIQLNDTHPSIAIPELMRILVDEELLDWDKAWDICVRTFAYTNHTILPEALETWPCELISRVLPRHMQIIFEINYRFLEWVKANKPGVDEQRITELSLIQEGGEKRVRMANLAIVGSHTVNGVSQLHTDIIKERVFRDFNELYPGRIQNKTNGVTPRRWLLQCNPYLSELLSEHIGKDWVCELDSLRDIVPLARDAKFNKRWMEIKRLNKEKLAVYIKRKLNVEVNLDSLFDTQIKRIHEYKRQLMNVLHAVTLFNRLKDDPSGDFVPRTIMFGGKAAPAYYMAKLIIRLINGVSEVVNNDPDVNGRLQVLFLPNYCVSQAERIIPATDLSEQISMAGMEASGTGNMKFALNGALTIGTLDGANVEMMEEIGEENMFIFGHTTDSLAELRDKGYDPQAFYDSDPELRKALSMISHGVFSRGDMRLYRPLVDSLLHGGDPFFVMADYRAYVDKQEEVSDLYRDPKEWTKRSILNTANMGKFSSDRAVGEYARDIWNVSYGKDPEKG